MHDDNIKTRFALSSQQTFARTDYITETERFYNTIMELLEDPNELTEVNELLLWWNRYALLSLFWFELSCSYCILGRSSLARFLLVRQ